MLFHVMFNAYWDPLVFELPPLVAFTDPGGGGSTRMKMRRTTCMTGPVDREAASCSVHARALMVLVAVHNDGARR